MSTTPIHPTYGDKPANITRGFNSFGSDVDLTTQSGCPRYCAGRLVVSNTAGSTQTLSYDGPDGTAVALSVPDGTVFSLDAQVQTINSATGTLTIIAQWWAGSAALMRLNP